MISIPITEEAYEALKARNPGFDPAPRSQGPNCQMGIWLDRKFVDRLLEFRGPGETYSDVIPMGLGRPGEEADLSAGEASRAAQESSQDLLDRGANQNAVAGGKTARWKVNARSADRRPDGLVCLKTPDGCAQASNPHFS